MGLMLGILTGASLLASALVAVWMAGAIYFDVCGGARWGRWVVLAWAVGVVAMFAAWRPLWQPIVALLGAESLFLAWWYRLKPSNDRDWDPSMAVLPRAVIAGDAVTIENVRNLEYRSIDDFTPQYETRTYHLSNLSGVDVIFFDWGDGLRGHPALVFDFGPDGRICMSIEARITKGQGYSVFRSLYRQQELIFVAADERDVILRRTKYSERQWAYLYRINSSVEELTRAVPRLREYDQSIVRDSALVSRAVHQLHDVLLQAPQHEGPLGLARHRQRPTGSGPLSGRSIGPDSALPGTPPTRLPQRHRERGPGDGVRGPHPPRTRKAPP